MLANVCTIPTRFDEDKACLIRKL